MKIMGNLYKITSNFFHCHHPAVHFFEAALAEAIDMVEYPDQSAFK